MLSRSRLLATIGASASLLALTWMLSRTPEYESRSSFQPATASTGASRLGGLAAQFGLDVGAADAAGSPDLYRALLRSRPILEKLAWTSTDFRFRRTWMHAPDLRAESILTALGVSSADSLEALEEAVEALRSRLDVSIVRESGIVQIQVRLPGPELARHAAQFLLDEVNSFNVTTRQSQAHAERVFAEERLTLTRKELAEAENSLRDFLQGNRGDPRASPTLSLEYDRLQREVATASEVVTSLRQSVEQARIDEVRDTPVITVLEPPSFPSRPAGPSLLLRIALAIPAGIVVSLGCGIAIYLNRVLIQSDPMGFARLQGILSRARTASETQSGDGRDIG